MEDPVVDVGAVCVQMGIKWIFVIALVYLQAVYYKRWKWAPIKSRRLIVDAVN